MKTYSDLKSYYYFTTGKELIYELEKIRISSCPLCNLIYRDCLCPVYEADGENHKSVTPDYNFISDEFPTEEVKDELL